MKRAFLLAVITSVASCLSAQPNPLDPNGGAPQQQVRQLVRVPDPDLLGTTYGDLVNLPPPTFIRPGVRLTYLTTSGKIQADGELVEHKDGDVIDPTSGKRYIWAGGRTREELSGGGASIDFVEVAAIDNNAAAILVKSYAYNILHGNLWPGARYGLVTNTGINTFWFNQAATERLLATGGETSDVRRLAYTMEDGKSYDALRISVGANAGSSVSHTYDLKTGILLRRLVVSGKSGFDRGGVGFQGTRNVQVMTLKDAQQQKLPWLGEADPAWANQFQGMHVQGEGNVFMPNAPQLPNTQIQGRMQVNARGNGWVRYHSTQHEVGMGQGPYESESTLVSGQGAAGSLFLPPQGLQKLQNQQILHTDHFSKIVTQVTFMGQSPDGSQVVVISDIANNTRFDYAYDTNSGALKRVVAAFTQDTTQTTKTVDLIAAQ